MGDTLHALSLILLKAVPTVLFLIFLHFYLKGIFYKPLEQVRRKRYEATEGARQRANESMERAAAKTAEYEAALRSAKGAVYQAQESLHRDLQEQQAAELHAARQQAEVGVQEAKAGLGRDLEAAKTTLARESEILANQIVETILRRSAA
jgi:F0F1-type ATP synthase membrane subunit b/b'